MCSMNTNSEVPLVTLYCLIRMTKQQKAPTTKLSRG